jgi:hypothetical protein
MSMQARCFCPEHGRLDFENILIKNGIPVCAKCQAVLEYGKVMPRPVASAPKTPAATAKAKRRKRR